VIAQCPVSNRLVALEVVERTSAGLGRVEGRTVVVGKAIVLVNKDSDMLKGVVDE
jgi:hypothetical protein